VTKRIGNVIILEPEQPQQCDLCGKVDELRPYGPNGSVICFDCAMEDQAGTEARMAHVLFFDPLPSEGVGDSSAPTGETP